MPPGSPFLDKEKQMPNDELPQFKHIVDRLAELLKRPDPTTAHHTTCLQSVQDTLILMKAKMHAQDHRLHKLDDDMAYIGDHSNYLRRDLKRLQDLYRAHVELPHTADQDTKIDRHSTVADLNQLTELGISIESIRTHTAERFRHLEEQLENVARLNAITDHDYREHIHALFDRPDTAFTQPPNPDR